jgi:hypothetical protein
MCNTLVGAGAIGAGTIGAGAGAALRYGSGSGSDQKMRLRLCNTGFMHCDCLKVEANFSPISSGGILRTKILFSTCDLFFFCLKHGLAITMDSDVILNTQ